MKNQFTPGPWCIFRDSRESVSVLGKDGRTIAFWELPEIGPDTGPSIAEAVGEESASNLALIAAAPELLEALENLLKQAKALDQSATWDGLENCSALAAARTAIARATGKEPAL